MAMMVNLVQRRWDAPLKNNLEKIFDSYGINELENVIHLSELNIIEKGIGKDNISDFTTQLILSIYWNIHKHLH